MNGVGASGSGSGDEGMSHVTVCLVASSDDRGCARLCRMLSRLIQQQTNVETLKRSPWELKCGIG